MQNTREARLEALNLEIDYIIQRVARLKEVQEQKFKEMIWLKEVINQEENKALAIKEEYNAIQHTKGGPQDV